jgi:hypothetical protein
MRKGSFWHVFCPSACAGLVMGWCVLGLAAQKAAPKASEAGAETKAPAGEGAASKAEKQIAAIQDRLNQLTSEESSVTMSTLQAQSKASSALVDAKKDPTKAAEELGKGNSTKEFRDYKIAMMGIAGQWQAFAGKFARVVDQARQLDRERDKAPAEIQPRIDETVKKVLDRNRGILERAADPYEKVAAWRDALGVYLSILKDVPENKRAGERDLKRKIADLYEKTGDLRGALAIYKGIFEAIPEKDRFKDRDLCKKLAELYEKGGDLKSALAMYKGNVMAAPEKDRYRDQQREMAERLGDVCFKLGDFRNAQDLFKNCLEGIGPDKREKDGAGLRDKIKSCDAKLGRPTNAPVKTSSNDNQKRY